MNFGENLIQKILNHSIFIAFLLKALSKHYKTHFHERRLRTPPKSHESINRLC